jgi:hypothetical protein
MIAQIHKTKDRIKNLQWLLECAQRIDETEMSRRVRDEIKSSESELKILKVKLNASTIENDFENLNKINSAK